MKTLMAVCVLLATSNLGAQTLPQFDGNTGVLHIPEVKLDNVTAYNATLQYEGNARFRLLGYDTQPAAPSQQVPPTDSVPALLAWLTTGAYKSWPCEAAAHGPTLNSAHGAVRICSNPLLSTNTAATFPVGSASVKELYSGNAIIGYAVGVKIAAGAGANTWYWYEGIGSSVIANGVGIGICEGCHAGAANDRVFVRVR